MKTNIFRKWWFWVIVVVIIAAIGGGFGTAGEDYTCRRCEKETSKIYYDVDGEAAYCADCAKDYWAPFDYKEYRAD